MTNVDPEMHVSGDTPGCSRHVDPSTTGFVPAGFTPGATSGPAPARGLNATCCPRTTLAVSGDADGPTGAVTVGVNVLEIGRPNESVVRYVTGVAAPEKLGSGVNRTCPATMS
jgi:hypothetical protein